MNARWSLNLLGLFLVMLWLVERYHRVPAFCDAEKNAMVLPTWQYLSVFALDGLTLGILQKL